MARFIPYLLLLIALSLRLSYSFFVHEPKAYQLSDIENYLRIADQMSKGLWDEHHFFQPFGFSYLLSLLKLYTPDWSTSLAVLQSLASTLTLLFIWKAVKILWGEKQGLLVLILGLFHVPWIIFTGYAMAETLYTLLLSVLFFASVIIVRGQTKQSGALLWGAAFASAFLLKGSHVFLFPIFLASLFLLQDRKTFLKIAIPLSLAVSSGFIVNGIVSKTTTGKTIISASTGGLNLVEGKCPSKKNIDSRGILWHSPLYYQLRLDKEKRWKEPFSNSSYFMREGLKCIAKNPVVLLQSFENIPYLFFGNTLWPTQDLKFSSLVRLYELFFTMFVLPGLMLYALLQKRDWKELAVLLMPVCSLFLLVYIFKSEIRYRLPFDVFIIPLSLRGWLLLREIVRNKRPAREMLPSLLEGANHGKQLSEKY